MWQLNKIFQVGLKRDSYFRTEKLFGYKIVPCGVIADLIIESLHFNEIYFNGLFTYAFYHTYNQWLYNDNIGEDLKRKMGYI